MGAEDKASNKIDDVGGKAKEALGKVTGDKDTENEGKVDQAKSSLKDAKRSRTRSKTRRKICSARHPALGGGPISMPLTSCWGTIGVAAGDSDYRSVSQPPRLGLDQTCE
jgi:uncharacterized protein YjbJ (UPF0337 family)